MRRESEHQSENPYGIMERTVSVYSKDSCMYSVAYSVVENSINPNQFHGNTDTDSCYECNQTINDGPLAIHSINSPFSKIILVEIRL